ncbi:MAG: amidohydrolase family protein [Novosphingobium sp.]|nr:amidohydrolase family protein [Novosphingobium sp.]
MARLILEDATIVDGENPPRRGDVVIAGELIEAVGEGAGSARPDDRVVALDGRTVMPGMILGHYHAGYWNMGLGNAPLGLDVPAPLQAVRAASNLRTALECGFTGVIGAGSPNGIDPCMKAAIAEGTIIGPRMMAGSRDVSSTGHSSDKSFPSHWQIGAKGGLNVADGPDAFRRVVREEIKDGAEIIKIFATDGHATGGDGSGLEISKDEFAAAVEAAQERGVKTRAHIANREAILHALELGVHIIDHGDGFDEACIERILEAEAFLTPSMFFPKVMMADLPGNPFTELMKLPYVEMAEILPIANEAGVRLLIGDDYGAGSCTHGRYAEELELYVNEVGIPALDVVRWATRNGAEAMGLDDQTGTLEAGKLADLLVIDGDPLADITVLQDRSRILAVLKGGEAAVDGLAQFEREVNADEPIAAE